MGVKITQEMIDGAMLAEKKYGIPTSITLAQIKLESGGNNTGGLSGLAFQFNNLFGQKAGNNEKSITFPSAENENGSVKIRSSKFKVYDSVKESIDDHGKKWGTSRVGVHGNAESYINAMQKKGYATDTNYTKKIMNIIKNDNLSKYDGKSLGNVNTPSYNSQQVGEVDLVTEEGFPIKKWSKPILKFTFIIICVGFGILFIMKSIDGGVSA